VDFVLEAFTIEEAEKKMDDFVNDYRKRIDEVGGGEMDLIRGS
jgi:hypothetical protein